MATGRDFVDYVAEQAQLGDALSFRRMFGEYGMYLDGKLIGFACDNSLFVKTAEATADLVAALPQRPLFPGSKPYPVVDELLDDSDALRRLLLATQRALPMPAPKTKKRKPGKRAAAGRTTGAGPAGR